MPLRCNQHSMVSGHSRLSGYLWSFLNRHTLLVAALLLCGAEQVD